eukprot:scaffold3341_cov171-Amphora_coffeaeformis.AAC.6
MRAHAQKTLSCALGLNQLGVHNNHDRMDIGSDVPGTASLTQYHNRVLKSCVCCVNSLHKQDELTFVPFVGIATRDSDRVLNTDSTLPYYPFRITIHYFAFILFTAVAARCQNAVINLTRGNSPKVLTKGSSVATVSDTPSIQFDVEVEW